MAKYPKTDCTPPMPVGHLQRWTNNKPKPSQHFVSTENLLKLSIRCIWWIFDCVVNVVPFQKKCWRLVILYLTIISEELFSGSPANTKHFVSHLYNVGPTSSTLVQHCTNVKQMFCVCWEAEYKYRHNTIPQAVCLIILHDKCHFWYCSYCLLCVIV